MAELRAQDGGDVLVNGSAQLVRALMDHDLVDEYRLMVFPVVLGEGKRLFTDGGEPMSLRLTDSKQAGETQIMVFEPAARED